MIRHRPGLAGWAPVALPAALLAACGLVASACSPGSASPSSQPPAPSSHPPAPGAFRADDVAGGRTSFILPPGENGLVNASQLAAFTATGARPPGNDDQLAMYAGLLYGAGDLTDSDLPRYFLDESFGVRPGRVTRVEKPAGGVTILRDTHQIPHVYGDSLDSMALGAGYAGAEDRLFFMDVLRHYAEGDLTSFLGPSCSFEQMDHDQLLSAGYTPAQLRYQLAQLPRRFGSLGAQTASMIRSYVDGVNSYIAAARSDPAKMPVDYLATPAGPQPWQPTDVVAITSLITTQATGGGAELSNAALVSYLNGSLGPSAGATAFGDFKEQNDPAAPTTITDLSFPYMVPGHLDHGLTALPDDPGSPLAGGPAGTTPGCQGPEGPSAGFSLGGATAATFGRAQASVAAAVSATLSALTASRGADSNAVVVGAGHAAGNHPIAVFGPELGYFAPEVLMVEDLHAPGYDAEGAAFPGTNLVVQLGRGRSYAWSATTASTDQIDDRVELLCNPGGGPVPPQATHYLYRGRCLSMGHQTFSEVLPSASGPLPKGSVLSHQIYTTVHGIVQGWTTDGGRPVAVVAQRATFLHDVDSLVGFLRWGEPDLASSPAGWMQGVSAIPYSFNWFYLNGRDIAYDVSGLDPVRPGDVDPNLPTWGTGGAEWTGFLSPGAHPHQVDPPQGYFTSWNNKPARLFSASDDTYGWGPVFRSQLLDAGLRAELAHGRRVTRAQVVQVAEGAATMDLSSWSVLPALRDYLGPVSDPEAQALLGPLTTWAVGGSHRLKPTASAAQYDDAATVAIWDEAYPRLIEALFSPIFAAGGVKSYDGLPSGYSVVQMGFENTPDDQGAHDGDGYYGGWDGYVQKALQQLLGRRLAQPFSQAVFAHLCGRPTACRAALLSALDATYAAMSAANGGTDVATWTQNTATISAARAGGSPVTMPEYDQIEFQAVGIVGQPPIDWQNRPTFQQVAQFPG